MVGILIHSSGRGKEMFEDLFRQGEQHRSYVDKRHLDGGEEDRSSTQGMSRCISTADWETEDMSADGRTRHGPVHDRLSGWQKVRQDDPWLAWSEKIVR